MTTTGERARGRARSDPAMLPRLTAAVLAASLACAGSPSRPTAPRDLAWPGERHLRNVRQLTLGGENAETNIFIAGLVE